MNEIGVGVLGFGIVGAGVVGGLVRHEDLIESRTGLKVRVKKIADLDIESDRGVEVDPAWLTTDANDVINDPDVHVIVETIGGSGIAKELTIKALKAGKSIVTANKKLLAEHGEELFPLAKEHGGDLYYEASVAGGIPIIKSLREGLVGNKIESIYGILNGTCNYILTRMEAEGIAFNDVLKEAQEAGFAEAEPSLDIDGWDTAHKAVILAGLAFGKTFDFNALHVDGIRGLDGRDVDYAAELGYRLKLLAVIKPATAGYEVRVHPAMVPNDHMLAKVGGAFNAVLVKGDVVGDTLYYGQGAGRFPTASAVISDVVDVARNIAQGCGGRVAAMPTDGPGELQSIGQANVRYYLRFQLIDRPGVLAKVTQALGEQGISIASVIQKERDADDFVPVVVLTQNCLAHQVDSALRTLQSQDDVGKDVVRIIVEDLN